MTFFSDRYSIIVFSPWFSGVPLIPVVAHAATAEPLFLEDEVAVEIVPTVFGGLAEIEVTMADGGLLDESGEEQVERVQPFSLGRGGDVLHVDGFPTQEQ